MLRDLDIATQLLERLVLPALMILAVFFFGTFGFLVIGAGKWTFFDCAYMTSITLTTVGYGETLDQMGRNARLFAMVLMWSGMGVTLYAVSTITAFVVEKNLMRMLKERQMERKIAGLKGHIIVCGAGRTGFNVIRELHATKRPCVVIEDRPERIEWIREQLPDLFFLRGDATEEDVLQRGGIENAAGLLAVLSSDSQNLLITVQARYINPQIKIVARCEENNLADKFYRAGANYVVNPAFIGGMRMASQMIRPQVVSFLDRMLRGNQVITRVEEVRLSENSAWVGRTLAETEIYRHTQLTPVAMKKPEDDDFTYNPAPEAYLTADTVLIVIGNAAQIETLRKFCEG
jgi:voltage-gated potassium channel